MRISLLLLLALTLSGLSAQQDFYDSYSFNRADTLRGSLRPERTCYDVYFYALDLALSPEKDGIEGHVDMDFHILENFQTLQIDLFADMTIDRILQGTKELDYRREYDAVFVHFPKQQMAGDSSSIRIYYHGDPTRAANAPWDGGFVWAEDEKGRPWMAVACEGDGASLWWPNKDHLSDEPDSMQISLTVPERYMAVANGNLREVTTDEDEETSRYDWFVSYPIDNYNVTFNIGHYVHFHDTYTAFDEDTLAMDYYVIDYNEDRAHKHFEQVHSVLACYEYYMDKYPFWEDGFALVETPYLGMEHQGAIAYGNRYMRGYLGGLIPRDMGWDYIIVHETGHEYYGNSIGCADLSEMWIQESFTTYLEALYVEYTMSYTDAVRYLAKQRDFISNKEPILGPMGVNWEDWDSSDHYYKGAWMLHTLRHAIGDDELWFRIFKDFYQQNSLSLITTEDFVRYVNEVTSKDWHPFFEQYLKYPSIPTLEYRLTSKGDNLQVSYRWQADVSTFDMPIRLGTSSKSITVSPQVGKWQKTLLFDTKASDFSVASDLFLVKTVQQKK